jgi:glycosyltransferase involved in cell wall biosynthesis
VNCSVIIPCHNAEKWICDALQSVAAQRHVPREIIVINDNSTDSTSEQITASGVDVRLIEVAFKNAAAARNEGAKAASSDWLAFLDADDMWYDFHLERANALLQHSSDVAFFSLVDWLYTGQRVVKGQNHWPPTQPVSGQTACQCVEYWTQHRAWQTSTMIVKRERFLAVGGFDPQQQAGQDFEMWLRLIHGCTWSYDPTATALYRADTANSVSRARPAKTSYFALQGVLKNRARYHSCAAYTRLLQERARLAASVSLMSWDSEYSPRVWELAAPYLRVRHWIPLKIAALWPSGFRAANRFRWMVRRLVS